MVEENRDGIEVVGEEEAMEVELPETEGLDLDFLNFNRGQKKKKGVRRKKQVHETLIPEEEAEQLVAEALEEVTHDITPDNVTPVEETPTPEKMNEPVTQYTEVIAPTTDDGTTLVEEQKMPIDEC